VTRNRCNARRTGAEYARDVLAALNSTDSFAALLNVVAAQAMELLAPTAVIIGKIEPATQTLLVQAAQGSYADACIDDLLLLSAEALSCAVAARSQLLFTEGDDTNVAGRLASLPDDLHVLLAVPIEDRDCAPYSGMFLYFPYWRRLSAAELELAVLLGSQVTLALANTHQKARTEEAALMSERNRIARELHDSVTHALFTISLISETLPKAWQSHPEAALLSVAKLQPLAQGALAEMRALLLELRADEGIDRNLGDLLRQLADRTHAFYDLPVTMTVVGDCPLPKNVQAAMYRITQEAINNAYKHAKARRVAIQLHCRPGGGLILRISDDGIGMEPGITTSHQLGLRIMRERAQEIGAALTITSEPGAGTRIVAVWQTG
jgi:signal transduction histidine kinase